MAAYDLFFREHRDIRVFRRRLEDLDDLRDDEVIRRYRLTRQAIVYVYQLIHNDIAPKGKRSNPVHPFTKLLVTLRVLAKGDFYSETGDIHGVSRSSVCRHVWQVIDAIDRRVQNINFPRDVLTLTKMKREFHRIADIPNCIGAIDGTFVPIIAPKGDEGQAYVCRKHYHALNVQAVVDANMRFTDLVARWPGSTHDSTVFQHCHLKEWLEEEPRGWLLGDSGYPLREYLITPKQNPRTDQEVAFNNAHSKTRMVIERAFGLLKCRFRCLHKTGGCLSFSPERCAKVVKVCCKLHNICIEQNVPFNDHVDIVNDGDNQLLIEALGLPARERLIRHF